MKNQILHSLWLRIIIESYLEVTINIFLHLTNVRTYIKNLFQMKWGTPSDVFSSLLAIIACGIYSFFPFFVINFLFRNFEHLDNDEIKKKWGSLYEPMKLSSFPFLVYLPLFLFRRLVFSFSAVVLT